RSEPVTFTVTPPPVITPAAAPPAPPVSSFKWFPSVPKTGEPVSLVSTSIDATSPIAGIAWALTSNGPFQGGGSVLTTALCTHGAHAVRLRVINAYGRSSVVTETIHVVGPTVRRMQPCSVDRIRGPGTASVVQAR